MNSSITLSLVSAMGQVVFTNIQNVFPGRQVVTLDVSAIRSGWYMLQIDYGDQIVRKPVVVD
ncbi:MAG: T9SS type A sorting domain-containing protein [Salinivirgaceae bacterium]